MLSQMQPIQWYMCFKDWHASQPTPKSFFHDIYENPSKTLVPASASALPPDPAILFAGPKPESGAYGKSHPSIMSGES